MRPLSKLLTATFATCVGGYAYYKKTTDPAYLSARDIFNETKLSPLLREYIQDNDLQLSFFSDMYQSESVFKGFLEESIIKDLRGLDYYNVYLNRKYQDVIIGQNEVSEKERKSMDKEAKMYCIFVPNRNVADGAETVHPGFMFTLLDSLGCYLCLLADDFVPPVTAYLNMNYHKPMEIGKEYVSVLELNKTERRKLFISAKVIDKEGTVYNSMESLYVKTSLDNLIVKEFLKIWSGLREKQLARTIMEVENNKDLQLWSA